MLGCRNASSVLVFLLRLLPVLAPAEGTFGFVLVRASALPGQRGTGKCRASSFLASHARYLRYLRTANMLLLRVRAETVSAPDLQPAVDALRGGGVVAYPTETFYGLAVDPRSAAAVERLFLLKHRPPE